jgi:hypothetical protein
MAMIRCAECGIDVSSEAKACPHCGKPVKRSSFAKKVGIGFAIFMGIGIIANASKSNHGSTMAVAATAPATPEPAAAPEQPATAVQISAVDLFREYDRNEVSADDAYKGKRLLVTGRVASINKNFVGDIVIELSTGQMFADIGATVQGSQKSIAAGLSKRQEVTLLCRGAGKVLTSPMLDGCLIQ